jgi:hypothetical protein
VDFKKGCENKGQVLSFCGVNAHFQNGRAEKKIRDLQDATRISLLHAIRKWPSAITIHFWPYAMRYVNDVNNSIPMKGRNDSLIELFSSTERKLRLRQLYHFGCPVYVSESNLQEGKRAGMKWKSIELVKLRFLFTTYKINISDIKLDNRICFQPIPLYL